jgi:hypothetical protein
MMWCKAPGASIRDLLGMENDYHKSIYKETAEVKGVPHFQRVLANTVTLSGISVPPVVDRPQIVVRLGPRFRNDSIAYIPFDRNQCASSAKRGQIKVKSSLHF